MEKSVARVISYVFHPILMTTLGVFIIFNSGTALSVIQPEIARIALIVVALFTSIFPVLLILLLYYTNAISDIELRDKKDRFLVLSLAMVMYIFSVFILRSIPQLTSGHILLLLCSPFALLLVIIFNNFISPSIHMLGLGMLTGIIFILIVVYGAPIALMFILAVIISGLVGTARMILNLKSGDEVAAGYLSGLLVTLAMLIFIV